VFCAQCGSANADEAKFCMKCGAAVQGTPPVVSAPAPPSTGYAQPGSSPSAAAGPTPYAPPLPSHYSGAPEMSGKAIGSLICGILFFFFPIAIVAVVLGHLSLSDIRKSTGRLTGRGVAIAGLVLGYMGLSVIPILIVAAIAIPNLLRARMAANEASAVESLRTINTTNIQYVTAYGNGYAPSLEILGGLAGETSADCNHALLIDAKLESGEMNGYRFSYTLQQPRDGAEQVLSKDAVARGCRTPGSSAGYSVLAEPVAQGTTGQRSFYTDATGTIRYSEGGTATADSTPLN